MFSIFLYIALLIPGLIPGFIDALYGLGRRNRVVNSIFVALIITTLSYLTLIAIYDHFDKEFPIPLFEIKQQDYAITFLLPEIINLLDSWREIAWVTLIAIIYLILWLPITRKRWIMKGLRLARLTDHFGERDVWTHQFTFGARTKSFIQIGDNQNKRYYTGWVKEFSEYDDFRELLLTEVEIHDFEFNFIAQAPTAYVGLPKDNVTILFTNEERRISNAQNTARKRLN